MKKIWGWFFIFLGVLISSIPAAVNYVGDDLSPVVELAANSGSFSYPLSLIASVMKWTAGTMAYLVSPNDISVSNYNKTIYFDFIP